MKSKIRILNIFIIAIIVILVVPIGINFLLPIEIDRFNILGDVKQWFNFWSAYAGAVVSGLITLWVLYKTLRQNQENHINQKEYTKKLNEEQRIFQVNLLKNQAKQKWLENLKQTVIDNLDLIDFRHIERLSKRITIINSNKEILDEISQLERKVKQIDINFSILYSNSFITNEQKLYKNQLSKAAENMIKILSTFSSYLIKLDKTITETNRRIDNFEKLKEPDKKSQAALLIARENGIKQSEEHRKNIISVVENYKEKVETINKILKYSTLNLIISEERMINKELKSYC